MANNPNPQDAKSLAQSQSQRHLTAIYAAQMQANAGLQV